MPDLQTTDAGAKSAAASATAGDLLAVQSLEAWYGESHVLHGMTFNV